MDKAPKVPKCQYFEGEMAGTVISNWPSIWAKCALHAKSWPWKTHCDARSKQTEFLVWQIQWAQQVSQSNHKRFFYFCSSSHSTVAHPQRSLRLLCFLQSLFMKNNPCRLDFRFCYWQFWTNSKRNSNSSENYWNFPWSWYCLLRTNTLDTEYIILSERTTFNQLPTAPYSRVAIAQSGILPLLIAFSHSQCFKAELAEHFASSMSKASSWASGKLSYSFPYNIHNSKKLLRRKVPVVHTWICSNPLFFDECTDLIVTLIEIVRIGDGMIRDPIDPG